MHSRQALLGCKARGNGAVRTVAPARRHGVRSFASIHARWCLDAKYGCKQDATALLQEWVLTVGSKAGLSPQNTRLSSGCLGVPESRLEMEVTFNSMADWESFLAAIPLQEHKAWTQRIQNMVVDGSPVWHVHRSVPLAAASTSSSSATAASWKSSSSSSSSTSSSGVEGSKQLVLTDQVSLQDIAAWNQLTSNGQQQRQSEPVQITQAPHAPSDSVQDDSNVPRDWKGDPMKLNPGDKLPFKFL